MKDVWNELFAGIKPVIIGAIIYGFILITLFILGIYFAFS